MKQLTLPFIEDVKLDIYELYSYVPGRLSASKTYSTSVDFTLAKNVEDAEEFFLKKYPQWWKTMGVKKVSIDFLQTKVSFLENQLHTCKFIVEAYNIVK